MILEYHFGLEGAVAEIGKDTSAETDRILKSATRRILQPGEYDITPPDTRYSFYDSQRLFVYREGHAELRGQRKRQQAIGKESEQGKIIQLHMSQPNIATSDNIELLDRIDGKSPIKFQVTIDGDTYASQRYLRRIVWRAYRYLPGAYSELQ